MSSSTPRLLRRLVRRLAGSVEDRSPVRSLRAQPPERLAAAVVAAVAGIVVFAIATVVFPYHSANHDEGVYLLQATMLLEGQLELHAGELADAFHHWFFIADEGRLYPKYNPVPAAMYAVSMALFDEPRVTLAAVAAGNTALVYWLGAMAFDRRVGVVAAVVFLCSPMTLFTSSVFLPYAPTTLLNLTFAVAYLRGVRDESVPSAAGAGVAIGLAFFSRPYTAVLFAAPFVCHACWTVWRALRESGVEPRSWLSADAARRNVATAAIGLAFVGLTLAYNARVTGSPLLFPYQAFAPLDGPGFGYREILDHSMVYTPEIALEANGHILWYFATRWFAGGLLGTLLVAAGLAIAIRRWRASPATNAVTDHERRAGVLLAGLFVTVPIGNVPFWGNRNVLATMSDPTDGLLAEFGPFYHFDLLAPLSIFAALALVTAWRRVRTGDGARTHDSSPIHDRIAILSPRVIRTGLAGALLLLVVGGGMVNAALVSAPLERNLEYTDRYEDAYEPLEESDLENALVFLPTPYGEWQGHPFQSLRNEPGFDGPVVYALDRSPGEDFAVVDAYPNRSYYRYAYRGEWTANPDGEIDATLERLAVRRGTSLAAETVVGVPDRVTRATVELGTDDGTSVSRDVTDPDGELAANWTLDTTAATLADAGNGSENRTESDLSVPLEDTDEVIVTVTLVQSQGATLTYRQEVAVRTTDSHVEVLWPPDRSVCPLRPRCGTEGTYVPGDPDARIDGVSFETRIAAVEGTRAEKRSRGPIRGQ